MGYWVKGCIIVLVGKLGKGLHANTLFFLSRELCSWYVSSVNHMESQSTARQNQLLILISINLALAPSP